MTVTCTSRAPSQCQAKLMMKHAVGCFEAISFRVGTAMMRSSGSASVKYAMKLVAAENLPQL